MKLDLVENPFFVLELGPDASAVDIERQGQRLLAELELGRARAREFATPFGPRPRDETKVRAALKALKEPRLRAVYARFAPPPALWPEPRAHVEEAAPVRRYPELVAVAPHGPRRLAAALARALDGEGA